MVSWSADLLKDLIAPDIWNFTSAKIEDLSEKFPENRFWLTDHFLNSALRARFDGKLHKLILTYLRRTSSALHHYESARAKTLEYLQKNDPYSPALQSYFDLLNEWENVCLQMQMVMDAFNKANELIKVPMRAFEKKQECKERSLYEIGNAVKHAAARYLDNEEIEKFSAPVWLTNAGLTSYEFKVTFSEISEILSQSALLAEKFVDPLKFKEQHTKPSKEVESDTQS